MGIGIGVKRQDALDKATGRAKYVEDLIPQNALYGQPVHSTIANGTVRAIHTEKAVQMPGVRRIFTCFDVPQHPYLTAGHPLSLDPDHQDVADKLLLARRVRFYGDDVAVVIADTKLAAQLAALAIEVEYDEVYKPALNPDDAMEAPCLHDIFPSNQLARMDFHVENQTAHFEQGVYEQGHTIGGEDYAHSQSFTTPAVHACHLENNSCFAYMENGRGVVVSCTQAPHTMRRNVASAVGLPLGKVRVIKPYMGGGFGNKQDTLYEPLALWASMQLNGRPVAIVPSREETFINSRTRHEFHMELAVTAAQDGHFTQRALRINANGGAYAAHGHAVTAYALTNFFEMYPYAPNQVGRSSTTYTNLPPAAAMRGYGIPQIVFAMESQMDDIAKDLQMDPIDLRMMNMQREGFQDQFSPAVADSWGLGPCLDKARQVSNWDEKRKAYDQFNQSSPSLKKGLGLAAFCYKIGVWPIQLENGACRIVLNEDGSGQIQIGATELGQGSDTVLAQMASEILTIPESKLTVVSNQDTDISPYDNGAFASRQTYISGAAVEKTAQLLKEKVLNWAARIHDISVDALDLKDESVIKKDGTTLCTITQVCQYSNFINDQVSDTEHLCAESTYTCKSICFVYGVSVADVEIDVPIGKINVKKIWAIHDAGKIINPDLARGQVHGGTAMGVGYALGEQLLFDPKDGKPLNNNLLDYKIPTAMDIPDIECHFVETYEKTSPFGCKGLAEPPLIPQAPAIRNALLHGTGVAINQLPLNPQRLVHAFLEHGLIEA